MNHKNILIAQEETVSQIVNIFSFVFGYLHFFHKELRWGTKKGAEVFWIKAKLRACLQLLAHLHAPEPSKFPDQECDGVALLKTFHTPPECTIITSCGNIPEQGKVNFNLKTKGFQSITEGAENIVVNAPIRNETEFIHSIDDKTVAYKNPPQSALFVPTYLNKTVFGLLYLHSSQPKWFQGYNEIHFSLIGSSLGNFFANLPWWIEI